MADNIVGSLFGVDPATLQRQQQVADQSMAYRYAQLDPMQQAKFAQYQGGAGLARGVGGLLGMEDPELAKASQIKQIASQVDMTSPDGLRKLASGIQSFAPQEALMAVQRAAELEKTQSEVTKNLREKQMPTSGLGKLMFERDELLKSGVPADDPKIAAYDKAIAAEGKGKGNVEVNLGGLAGLFAKKEAEASAKEVTDQIAKAQEQLKTNSKLSRDIAELEKIIPATFTGQLSDIAKTSSKTLSAIGVPISEKASNTEVANALFNNFVLPAVKQLPGSLAAKELAFLQQSKPNALQEPATINRLIKMVKEDIAANRALVKRADAYQKQDKLGSLQGFNIALQSDEIYTNLNRYNALKAKVQAKQPITKEDADFAKSVEKELGL